jgi:hypothetical protein
MGRRRSFAPYEDDIQTTVVDCWRWLGEPDTLVAACPNKRAFGQPGLTKGLPDLLVLGPRVPNLCAFIELKRERGSTVSDEQLAFGALCARLGLTWKVTRGPDEPIPILEAWGVVRRDVGRARQADPAVGSAGVEESEGRRV